MRVDNIYKEEAVLLSFQNMVRAVWIATLNAFINSSITPNRNSDFKFTWAEYCDLKLGGEIELQTFSDPF